MMLTRYRTQAMFRGHPSLFIPLAVLAYGLALHWTYSTVIQPEFAYTGRRYSAPEPVLAVFTWIIASLVAATLPRRITQPSGVVLWVIYVVAVAPTILMGTYLDILSQVHAVWAGFGFGLAFALASLSTRRATPAAPLLAKRLSPTSFWLAIGLFSAFVYAYLALTAGLSLRLLSIFDVYDVREDYATTLSGAGLLGYLVSPQATVVNPLIIARGIYTRNWHLVAVGVLGQLVIYSGTGFKTVLFSLPAILIVALIFRPGGRPSALVFLWGATGVVILSMFIDSQQNGVIWTSLFARRFLTTPASLTANYVDYYSSSESFEMLSHSVLAPFFLNPPHMYGPARTIGEFLSGSTAMSANANLFADGYAHFGWIGVAIVAAVLAIFLRLVDRAAVGLPTGAASLVVLMPAITLANTSILTAMLTHGLVAMVVALALAPSEWRSASPRDTAQRGPLSRKKQRAAVD